MKLNWGKTFVLGFGFLAISAVWPLYDSYMPNFLESHVPAFLAPWAGIVVGLIMGIDNLLGLTLQPWISARSDRTHTRWGRRRPYLLVGMPIATVALALLMFTFDKGWGLLVPTIFVLTLSMALFRSPTVALMPDLTPPPLRSKANGVINFMGGIGAAIVLFAGKELYKASPGLPFVAAGAIMLVVWLLFVFVIREPEVPQADSESDETPQSLIAAMKHMVEHRDWNAIRLLLAIFSWFVAYQAVNTWFTTYSAERFHVPINTASGALLGYTGAFIVGALPAGYVGTWIGRRRAITIGLVGMIASFGAMHFVGSLSQMTILLVVAGLFWSLININSFPMVWQICHPSQTGTYTGLYYIFSGIAGFVSPSIAGALFTVWGSKRPLFIMGAVFMALALFFMASVKKGEAEKSAAA
ncbi:MAG TPA: MFS transporter [Symbiobacteriaceae bacterium]|nr:MFS transporter [Symbiobacteriaceae bacterium]